MKIKRGDVLFICIIWLLMLLVVIIVYAQTYLNLACRDISAVQKGTPIIAACSNITTKGDSIKLVIQSRSNAMSYLYVNYTGGTIPADQTIGPICVNFTALVTSGDNNVANFVNITFWKASAGDYFRIANELDVIADAYTTYEYCENTIITTVDDANALKVLFKIKGDATASDDGVDFDYINTNISYSAPTNPPTIDNVSIGSSQSIVENGVNNVTFSFIATDPDGVADLNDARARARVNITVGAITTINNAPCSWVADIGGTANYSCGINIWYWDANGTWTVNVSIADIGGAVAENRTANFALGVTGSIQIAPTAINFGELKLGISNNTATDDPITINNTGNLNVTVGNVRLKAIDLSGADTKTIGAGNFTIGISTGSNAECDWSNSATKMVNNTATGITRAGLGRGNLSSTSIALYQEQMYFCFFKPVPSYLTFQTYDTTAGGSWTIDII